MQSQRENIKLFKLNQENIPLLPLSQLSPPQPPLTDTKPKILIISNSQPCYTTHGGYCLQVHYLFNMFVNEYSVYFMGLGLKELDENITYTFDEFKNKISASPYHNSKLKQSLRFNQNLKDIKYTSYKFTDKLVVNIGKINEYILKEQIDVCVFLGDAVIFRENTDFFAVSSYCWYPCHYFPISNGDKEGLQKFSDIVCLAPSVQHILKKLQENGEFNSTINVHYIPHVIECHLLVRTKEEIREEYGISADKWVVLVNATFYEESERKNPEGILYSFKKFVSTHPNSVLFIHSFVNETVKLEFEREIEYPDDVVPQRKYLYTEKINGSEIKVEMTADEQAKPKQKRKLKFETNMVYTNNLNYPIQKLINNLGFEKGQIIYHQEAIEYNKMMEFYKMSDVLLSPSCSEGFGVPILEAQSYELPVITSKFLAMDDYNMYGVSVSNVRQRYNYLQDGFWVIPDVDSITEAMIRIYENRVMYSSKKMFARMLIENTMNFDSIKRQWNEIIEKHM